MKESELVLYLPYRERLYYREMPYVEGPLIATCKGGAFEGICGQPKKGKCKPRLGKLK